MNCKLTLAMLTITLLSGGQFANAQSPAEQPQRAKPGSISYTGGDGSSFEKAILIKGAMPLDVICNDAQRAYYMKHHPHSREVSGSLQRVNGRSYQGFEIKLSNGGKKTLYFNITEYVGK
jgi:hypothetical protein